MDYRDPEWVASRLGLDKATVYRFLQDGVLPAVQLGRKWLVSESRLEQWLREETDRQTAARRGAAESAERTVRRMDNFSANARDVLRLAHTEARRHNHGHLGQEHMLLGLASCPQSMGARVLRQVGVDLDDLLRIFESRLLPGEKPSPRRLGRSAQAKKAMRLAARQAAASARQRIGSGHWLLGLLLAGEGWGYDVLVELGVNERRAREAIAQLDGAAPDAASQ